MLQSSNKRSRDSSNDRLPPRIIQRPLYRIGARWLKLTQKKISKNWYRTTSLFSGQPSPKAISSTQSHHLLTSTHSNSWMHPQRKLTSKTSFPKCCSPNTRPMTRCSRTFTTASASSTSKAIRHVKEHRHWILISNIERRSWSLLSEACRWFRHLRRLPWKSQGVGLLLKCQTSQEVATTM